MHLQHAHDTCPSASASSTTWEAWVESVADALTAFERLIAGWLKLSRSGSGRSLLFRRLP